MRQGRSLGSRLPLLAPVIILAYLLEWKPHRRMLVSLQRRNQLLVHL